MAKIEGRGVGAGGKWTEQHARAVLGALDASGESVSAFARKIGVVPQRLHWWRRRLACDAIAPAETRRPAFVPVIASRACDAGAPALVVSTPCGARIEVHEVNASTAAWVALFGREVGS